MSWQIPTLIEADIKNGKAQYRTFQTGNGGQSILPVPPNSYVVIFGYDFSPAGGGLTREGDVVPVSGINLQDAITRVFQTQQIAFYTGTDFYPFIHHVNAHSTPFINAWDASAPDNNFTSTNDVTITHGLIQTATRASANAIPVTNRTPIGLTYGGSPQVVSTQSNYGPAGTPLQFMQPSPKDYQDFAFGLLPANADGQAFATPDAVNGLIDATSYLNTYGANFVNAAAANYYLCLHYALYTETVPESRG
jgi:hypothetical protein